ncbi:hypothetical protein V6N13_002127 [Hibiscus sabdariffa]
MQAMASTPLALSSPDFSTNPGSLEFTVGVEVGECGVGKLVSNGDSGVDWGGLGGKGNGFGKAAMEVEGKGRNGEG